MKFGHRALSDDADIGPLLFVYRVLVLRLVLLSICGANCFPEDSCVVGT